MSPPPESLPLGSQVEVPSPIFCTCKGGPQQSPARKAASGLACFTGQGTRRASPFWDSPPFTPLSTNAVLGETLPGGPDAGRKDTLGPALSPRECGGAPPLGPPCFLHPARKWFSPRGRHPSARAVSIGQGKPYHGCGGGTGPGLR